MELRYLFKKTQSAQGGTDSRKNEEQGPQTPQGLFHKCTKCGETIFSEELKRNLFVCPKCGNYFRMFAATRIDSILDDASFEEWDADLQESNPLGTPGYEDKLAKLRDKTSLDEAVVTGKGLINGHPACLAVMDCRFMMASMGSVVGEKITRMFERATEDRLPVIVFTASGGARMQEGIISLMQMAKTSAAIKKHSDAGLLYVTILTDPTTGGVTASFAMLGDIILAEPGALIGFAGPRVIEQTIGQKLPEGFQRAEFLRDHGFVDDIVTRSDMKDYLTDILAFHEDKKEYKPGKIAKAKLPKSGGKLTPWDKVMISRGKDRPVAEDYIKELFPDFIEFHGDRFVKDDKAVMGGIATFAGKAVTVIAESKGHDTKENIERNFGMPSPDGYRKALRLMRQAEKFGRPVICFVDTPGAYCGLEAEERGQGEAIARNLYEMSSLKVPVLSIIISEAGSGGALALAVSDEVWMFENAIYAILSPEGYASILWKDSKRASEAAAEMKLTAKDMMDNKIIDKIIAEPENLCENNIDAVVAQLKEGISGFIGSNEGFDGEELAKKRYERYRRY